MELLFNSCITQAEVTRKYFSQKLLFRNKSSVGSLIVLLIGAIDYLTTAGFSLAIFHLLPIAFVAWFAGRWSGILLAILGATIWWIADFSIKPSSDFWLICWNATINFGFFVITSYLISTLKLAYEREKYLARTDPLTGAINRRYFLELLQTELERSRRHQDPLSLAYIDVDNFKDVNDRLGHSTGDRLLCLISQISNHQIRSIDVFARLGGDEFALLLPQTNYEQAEAAVHRLYKCLSDAVENQPFSVSFSIGAVTFVQLPVSANQAIEQTDRLMYMVKKSGKNGLQHILIDTLESIEVPTV
jgi:diguanylate cyclase (GGDEF)-like protein